MFYRRLFLFVLIAAEFGCQKKAAGLPPRYAVLRFENLTGDPSLDWAGRAASEMLSYSLNGAMDGAVLNSASLSRLAGTLGVRPAAVPGVSAERTLAIISGATRLITGYVSRTGGQIRVVAQEEDVVSSKSLRTVAGIGASPFIAISQAGHQFSPRAKPYLTGSEAAARLYFSAAEAPLESSEHSFEEVLKLDPDFGPAWLSYIRIALVRGDRAAAIQRIADAHSHKPDPLTRANLDFESASLKDAAPERLAALKRISELTPGDTILLRTLAESETTEGKFTDALADWKRLLQALPNDATAWNSIGYLHSYLGDYAGALSALNEYKRLKPGDSNPLDSLGDIHYSFGKFSEAAASYEAANTKDSASLKFGDLYKAAWAKFNAGDKAGADALFEQFRAARVNLGDNLIPLLTADWFYRTGRAKEGRARLQKSVAEAASNTPLRAQGAAQLAVWELLEGNRSAAQKESDAAGQPATPGGAIVRFTVMPSASAAEWKLRVERLSPDPAAASLKRIALGYALVLDGKRTEALPVWQEIVKSAAATDFFIRAVYTRLQGKPLERPLLPDPNSVNQFRAVLDKL